MMPKNGMVSMFELSEKVASDLNAILDYSFLNFGSDVMLAYHQSLADCFDMLVDNPELGTPIKEVRENYLCFAHRSHLVFYKQEEAGILIVRILHKSMDVSQHL